MQTLSQILPDVTRPDSRYVRTGQFLIDPPDMQRAAADAFLDVWDQVPWPDGLLSISVYLGTDGEFLQHYAQWSSAEANDAFLASGAGDQVAEIVKRRVPGIFLEQSGQYTLYRSMQSGSRTAPGCIVVVETEFDGPDEQRQRDWVDAVFEALEDPSQNPPGALSAHFHLSTDGRRVLNYAEWESEAAHHAAVEAGGGSSVGSGPRWDRVHSFPGLKHSRVKRFTPYRSRGV